MRNNGLLHSLLMLCIIFLGLSVSAQESIQADKLTNQWTTFTTQDGLDISIRIDKCDIGADKEFTFAYLSFHNTTDREINVEYQLSAVYDNKCVACELNSEYSKSISISSQSSLEGVCGSESGQLTILLDNPYQVSMGDIKSIKLIQLNTQ